MVRTKIGDFPVGFRLGWSDWQKDIPAVCRFAKESGFEFLDVPMEDIGIVRQVLAAGLGIGTFDLPRPWELFASAEPGRRKAMVEKAAGLIRSCAALGVKTFFAVAFPDDPARKRSESLPLAAAGFAELCSAISDTPAKIALEGWPGSPPHFSALACTPESIRALFDAIGSPMMGINFDPSHLIRMGIDPVRFAGEFAGRIWHVHAKDTEISAEALYEFGNLQSATFAAPHGYGGHHWRYTIPGHGNAPWPILLKTLKDCGYAGGISVELEDEQYNGTEAGEKRGLLESLAFLRTTTED